MPRKRHDRLSASLGTALLPWRSRGLSPCPAYLFFGITSPENAPILGNLYPTDQSHMLNSEDLTEGSELPTDTLLRPDLSARGIAAGRVRWYSIASLVLIAACLAEFLTGSTPVLGPIVNPLGFAFNLGLYGGGALLIREAAIHWGKRWGAVLLLGGAYAVGEEGFAAKTMIDPISPIIGNQLYSHWAGVNWLPLADLTVFHSAFSMAVPLLLLELTFPETRGRRLLGRMGLATTIAVYAITVLLLSLFLGDPYTPPLYVTVFLAAYASAFIAAAYLAPRSFLGAKGERPDRRERSFLLLGLGFMGGFFLSSGSLNTGWIVERLLPWPIATVLVLPLAGFTAWYLVKHAGRSGNDLVKIDFLLGMSLVFVPIDILGELGGDTGVLLFTALVLAMLILLRRRVRRLENANLPQPINSPPPRPRMKRTVDRRHL